MRKCFLLSLVFSLMTIACHKDLNNTPPDLAAGNSMSYAMDALTPKKRVNIIFIMSDDIGYEIPTYNGGQSYSTPNLDKMAANGVQFPNFFSHPDGGPSRLAALTGKYSFRNYVDWGYLPPDSKTFGNMLKDAAMQLPLQESGRWMAAMLLYVVPALIIIWPFFRFSHPMQQMIRINITAVIKILYYTRTDII
jgi:arylsulfatase A